MSWPGSTVPTTNLDAGSDSPAAARTDLKDAVDKLNTIIGARAATDGVASLDSSGKVPLAQIPTIAIQSGVFVDSTPGSGKTWTVPAGVTKVRVRFAGGGGGGGYVSPGTGGDHGGGGGAGAVCERLFDVVPGSVFNYTVGAAGVGKASSSDGDGTDGGESQVVSPASATPSSLTVRALGGGGGEGPPNRYGGAGGEPIDGYPGFWGGAGASGEARGGMGGANRFTGGSAGAPGYGGGGGFGSGDMTDGFDGLEGVVIFEW